MSKRKVDEIRKLLGPRTTDEMPYRNPRDLFEDALEVEAKQYKEIDTMGRAAADRVCGWFEEGVQFARQNNMEDPGRIPIWWATMYRDTATTAMIAGYMSEFGVVVDEMAEEVYKA